MKVGKEQKAEQQEQEIKIQLKGKKHKSNEMKVRENHNKQA